MFSRNFYTPPETARLAYLESLCIDDVDQQRLILEYRDYYAGDHQTQLTDRQIAFLEDRAGSKFRLNQCPNVVEALVDRLEVSGFEVIAETEESEEIPDPLAESGDDDAGQPAPTPGAGLADFAQLLWEENRMDAGQEEAFRQAAIDWLTYVVLDIDAEGHITFNHNDAYTSSMASIPTSAGAEEGVKLHYATANRRGKPIFATKRWAVTDGPDAGYRRYFTVYYPDKIERYYQDDRELAEGRYSEVGWQRLIEKEGPLSGVWPQPWVDITGQPLGIPVIEFRNGRASELSEVTPIQRALNKSFIDLIAAADASGFGVLFASGWVPLDAEGNPLKIEPGSILYAEGLKDRPAPGLARVPADDLTRLIQVLDRHILSIAQVSRTPISNFQLFGQIPSADSQKQLEAGLLAKCKSRQRVYGNAWEDLIYLARRVALGAPRYGTDELAGSVVGYGLPEYAGMLAGTEGVKLGTLWQDTQTRNERDHLETLKVKKELGVPQDQLYLEMGYSQQQANKWAAQAEERRLAMVGLMDQGQDQNVGGGSGEQDQAGRAGAFAGAGSGGQPNNGNGRGAG